MKNTLTLTALAALLAVGTATAQQNSRMNNGMTSMVGKMDQSRFDAANRAGAAAVSAVAITSAPLSSADKMLMMKVAAGGTMQLEASKIAVQKASSEEVRKYAQAEVEEQTGLAAKLGEIGRAKGVMLPGAPDAKTQVLLGQLQGASGADFDRLYVREIGVKGHEKINQVMTQVYSTARDRTLRDVAKAAHPLVKTHLKVARQVQADVKTSSSMTSGR